MGNVSGKLGPFNFSALLKKHSLTIKDIEPLSYKLNEIQMMYEKLIVSLKTTTVLLFSTGI